MGGMQAQVQARLQVQVHEFSLCSRVVQVGGVQVGGVQVPVQVQVQVQVL